jgi:hypothetical protein
MVGKSVSEKLKEKAAKAPEQNIMTDDGFAPVGQKAGGDYKFFSISKTEEGFALIGKFLGVTEGKFGDNARILTDDGEVRFTITAGMKDLLAVEEGAIVRVKNAGLAKAKNGREFRKYEIAVKKA